MRKIIKVIFLFCCFNSEAQYFDWNKVVYSSDDWFYQTHLEKFEVNSIGLMCLDFNRYNIWETFNYEDYYDSLGNFFSRNNDEFDPKMISHFDHSGNIIRLKQVGNDVVLNYFKPTDTLQLLINSNFPFNTLVEADVSKRLYVGYLNYPGLDTIVKFDSTGAIISSYTGQFTQMKCDDFGNLFLYYENPNGTATISKIDSTNNQVAQYIVNGSSPFVVSKNGRLWCYNNGMVKCYGSLGLLYSIPVISYFYSNLQMITDKFENLYIWEDNEIRKYYGDSLLWSVKVDASGNERLGIDDNANLYYAGKYAFTDDYDNYNSNELSINIPPNLFIEYDWDTWWYKYSWHFRHEYTYIGKIASAPPDTFYATVSRVGEDNISKLCASTRFNVIINYHQLPVQLGNENVYIELSNSGGSFNNPYIINDTQVQGSNKGVVIPCIINDSVPAGSGYRIRMRLGNGVYISNPHDSVFKLSKPPLVSLYLDNSLTSGINYYYSCSPFKFTASFDSVFNYSWYTMLFNVVYDPEYNFLTETGNSLILSDYFDELGVVITDTNSGCYSIPKFDNYIVTLDSNNVDSSYYFLSHPDTVRANDIPVRLITSYYDVVIQGPGVYYDSTDHHYFFYPDSVVPGLIPITGTLNHTGTPCIPYTFTHYIFVDSTSSNIITGNVSFPGNHLCEDDTFWVPFSLLDSTLYDNTNVFNVEMTYFDNNIYSYIFSSIVGSGITSPIMCIADTSISKFDNHFRVTSTQTGEKGTFNVNGAITVINKPSISPSVNYPFNNCYIDTIRFNVNYPVRMNLYYLNNLIYSDSGTSFIYAPTQDGFYKIEIIGECYNVFDSIEVNHNTHIPTLSNISWSSALCGKSSIILSVTSDSLTSLQWFLNNDTLAGEINDSLIVSSGGQYAVIATNNAGCSISLHATSIIYDNPQITLSPVGNHFQICPGNTLVMQTHYQSNYSYKWMKNSSTIISTNYNVNITDTGYYFVIVTGTQNCIDTSETIYVTYSVHPPQISPSGPITLVNGNSVTLNTIYNPAYHYQWTNYNSIIPGAVQPTFKVTQSGQYRVLVSDLMGCSVLSMPVSVNRIFIPSHDHPSTLRNQNNTGSIFTLYPNPNTGTFELSASKIADEELHLLIIDLYGRIVFQEIVSPMDFKLDSKIVLNEITDGIYSLQLKGSTVSEIIPLLIAK